MQINCISAAGKCRYWCICTVAIRPELTAWAKLLPWLKMDSQACRNPWQMTMFFFFWQYEILRWKNFGFFFFFCGNMQIYLSYFFFIYLRIQGFQLLKLMVSAPTPYETFHFTTVFHLSFKSLLNSCPKWILLISRYWVNS